MNFADRVKKEMTEGIVKAILEHAEYRVIDSGIEKFIRELSCLSAFDYVSLKYPEAITMLPDFIVMDIHQTHKFLVEVKYRSEWGSDLFEELREQVKIFGEIVLVSLNANPPDTKNLKSPACYLRCCSLKFSDGEYLIELNKNRQLRHWVKVNDLNQSANLWWAMMPLQDKFQQMTGKRYVPLQSAIDAISGILN